MLVWYTFATFIVILFACAAYVVGKRLIREAEKARIRWVGLLEKEGENK